MCAGMRQRSQNRNRMTESKMSLIYDSSTCKCVLTLVCHQHKVSPVVLGYLVAI